MNGHCLICGRGGTLHDCHWPIAKGMGGRSKAEDAKLPRVPMCFRHHIEGEHGADHDIIEILIARAPGYWESIGKWEQYRETFEKWVELYRYKQAHYGSGLG